MKKHRHNFTLTEVLTVIGIISILAAITTPVVIMARDRGRIAQAQGDITAIVTALKQLEADYHRVLDKNGKIGGKSVDTSSDGTIAILPKKDNSKDPKKYDSATYDAMIIELSAPKIKKDGSTQFPVSVNKRRKIYLDPKKEFDPSMEYDNYTDEQTASLYRDPWGNPYVVYIKVARDDSLKIPDTSKTIPGNFAAYSCGPNGTDDMGCNADLENCIGGSGEHRDHDDIASWNI